MLKTLSIALALFAFVACNTPENTTTETETKPVDPASVEATYTLDAAASSVKWKGAMLGLYSHEGTLNFKSGKFTVKGGQLLNGEFTVDMTSIAPVDDNFTEEKGHTKGDLIGHLSSADFFDVENNPAAKLTIVDGVATLTLRDKSNSVELDNVKLTEDSGVMKASADMTFNRQNFGVAFSMGMADKVLSDDIATNVMIVAKKN